MSFMDYVTTDSVSGKVFLGGYNGTNKTGMEISSDGLSAKI